MRISDWSPDVCSSDLMRKPFLGTAEGERAGFGPAIMLEDERHPPVDHCFLEMRRTGRRAMHDDAEARQVVAVTKLLRKLEQQLDHRRNDEQLRYLLSFDSRETQIAIEPRLDDHT